MWSARRTSPPRPQAILALAASHTGYQAFNPYQDFDPELKITPFGPASGVGSGFAFDSKDGTGSQTVAAVSAQQVIWSMDADMGVNPLLRVMGLLMNDIMGATFEHGLSNLEEAV